MNGPKANEVWMTKAQRLVLIVATHPIDAENQAEFDRRFGPKSQFAKGSETGHTELKMLWLDHTSGEFTVSLFLDRLDHKTEMNSLQWFEMMVKAIHHQYGI